MPAATSIEAVVAGAAALLRERAVPLHVSLGARLYTQELITQNTAVVTETDDRYGPSPRQRSNPRPLMSCTIGARIAIEGASSATGADIQTHRAHVRRLVHQVIAAFVVTGLRQKLPVTFISGGFDGGGPSQEYGARYVLLMAIDEVVTDAAWQTVDSPDVDRTDKMIHPDGAVTTLEN